MVIFNQWLLFKSGSSCITQGRKLTYICWMEEVMNWSIYKPLLKIFSFSCLLKGTSIAWSRKPFTTWPFYISKNISCYLSNIPLALILLPNTFMFITASASYPVYTMNSLRYKAVRYTSMKWQWLKSKTVSFLCNSKI